MSMAQRRDARVARRKARRAGLAVPGSTRIVEPRTPKYLDVCIACGKQDSCPVWKLSTCACTLALNGDPRYPCPKGLF